MSLFGSIVSKIFGSSAPATPQTLISASTATAAAGSAASSVDVAKIMDDLAEKSDEDFDWRKSIVDLLKLLQLDSSLDARRGLAKELGYTADTSDSASMNVWLHKQVMTMLAANGGKVPDSLKS